MYFFDSFIKKIMILGIIKYLTGIVIIPKRFSIFFNLFFHSFVIFINLIASLKFFFCFVNENLTIQLINLISYEIIRCYLICFIIFVFLHQFFYACNQNQLLKMRVENYK